MEDTGQMVTCVIYLLRFKLTDRSRLGQCMVHETGHIQDPRNERLDVTAPYDRSQETTNRMMSLPGSPNSIVERYTCNSWRTSYLSSNERYEKTDALETSKSTGNQAGTKLSVTIGRRKFSHYARVRLKVPLTVPGLIRLRLSLIVHRILDQKGRGGYESL
ncbi:hypothetical protein BDY19DRAFT_909897 [Irpex rosettiformis]|uniref:Uncharacterized protein n=1 Tax=Irpex rosettiformis TaxID=378272 RepID=A0ACB8TQW0_9APHY|nr:hypothetical protein BDY19DRAFT_909897 [Irpex rosettiformis]